MIKREIYMSRIRPFIGNELIKVLTGIRRSGKSVMLNLIQEELAQNGVQPEQFISLNFENMSNAHLCTAVALHDEILRRTKEISGKVYLFFDEIQEVADWEKCINSFRVELDCDIYITGSNAKLLSGELATYLAGRYVEFVIYPFSFREFMELYHTVYEGADERQCFTKYLTLGGMPYLSNLRYDDAASRQYLRDLFNSVELKDIIKRNNIRDVDMLERIIAYITSNIGTTFSSTAISKYLKSEGRSVSPETVLNYIKACTDATVWCAADKGYFRGGGFSSRFLTRAEMPVTMLRLNLVKGLGPVMQIAEGWTINLPDEVSDILWKRTDYTWPCTWFAPRMTGKGAFATAYDVMNNWGANHGAISYAHIGADVITLCSMLRIPVCMHNVPEEKIFRPSSWNAFGMDKEGQDYRACSAYGPMYRNIR